MTRSRIRAKGRRENGRFAGIPHAVMQHPCYITLTNKATRLLLELAMQYNSVNNGDLTAAWSVMRKRGWKSRDTLDRAAKELVDHKLIVKTRQGGRNRCNLYALTWNAIDNCKGKLDVPATNTPPGDWLRWQQNSISDARKSGKSCPQIGVDASL